MELDPLSGHLTNVLSSNKSKSKRAAEEVAEANSEAAGLYTKRARTLDKEKANKVNQITGLLKQTQPKKRSRSQLKKLIAIQGKSKSRRKNSKKKAT